MTDIDRVGAAEGSKGGAAGEYGPVTTRYVDDIRSDPAQPVIGDRELVEEVEVLVIAVNEREGLGRHLESSAQLVNIDTPVAPRPQKPEIAQDHQMFDPSG
ncbi:hypothetical protein E3O53_12530 [Cryobacterium sp. TMT2-18-3]|nr:MULTISPECIES: hypothetical protein [unclassified Cryobacterium]TFC28303.1 hypothetical protein E3O22_08595 [Cryobacterium sp. TMT2-18-2]TFC62374.1 hypothetical protein E3O53_12530 [Cryobacterium sp. TMT2-18-3]